MVFGLRRWSVVGGRWSVVALAALAVAVAGCSSGSGTVGAGQSQQDLSAQHVTSVMLVRRWTQIVYNLQVAVATACTPSISQVAQPDGSQVFDITFAECVREKKIVFPDGHYLIEDQFPDGTSQKVSVSAGQTTGNVTTLTVLQEYSNGDTVSYDYSRDTRGTRTNPFDDIEQWRGQVALKGQQAQTFTVRRQRQRLIDDLETALPDGSKFTMTVPLARAFPAGLPRFTTGTKGSYTTPGGRIEFQLIGAGATQWNEWTLTAPGDVTGRFALNGDFSGSGQFFRGGKLDSSIAWDHDGKAAVTLLSGEATTAGPSAAALDFLAHAWRAMFASGAPGPGTR